MSGDHESFATIGDVNLVLGYADEKPLDYDTCDGQCKTRSHAAFRLARIVGEDGHSLSGQDIESMAEAIYTAQVEKIATALQQVARSFGDLPCEQLLFPVTAIF